MNVNDVWLEREEQGSHLAVRVSRPDGVFQKHQFGTHAIQTNLVVAEEVGRHLVAASAKHLDFEFEDHIFASALLVIVVNDEYFHVAGSAPFRGVLRCNSRRTYSAYARTRMKVMVT